MSASTRLPGITDLLTTSSLFKKVEEKLLTAPARLHICLVAEMCTYSAGLGDLYTMINLFNFIKEHFPNIEVTLHGLTQDEEIGFSKLIPPPVLTSINELPAIAEKQATLIIHGPVSTPEYLPQIKAEHTLWCIDEFNQITSNLKPMIKNPNPYHKLRLLPGVGPDCIGINCNLQLRKISEQLSEAKQDADESKLQLLSHTALKNLLLSRSTCRLTERYLGYSHDGLSKVQFMCSILNGSKSNEEDIDVCLLGEVKEYDDESGETILEMIDRRIKEPAVAANFQFIQLCAWNSEKKMFDITVKKISDTPGKTMRVIQPGTLSQNDFLNLLIASEKFVLVTGDQSTAQALILKKIIFAEGLKSSFLNAIQALFDFKETMPFLLRVRGKYSLNFRSEKVRNQFDKISDCIYMHHNLEVSLHKHITEWVKEFNLASDNVKVLSI